MTAPRVTVVVPCYNDGALVRELRASLVEEEDVRLLVVDDGSTDARSIEALRALENNALADVIWQKNQGTTAAVRAGVERVTTPYVLVFGADDLLAPGAIGDMADQLDADPTLTLVYGDYVTFGRIVRFVRTAPWDRWVMLTGCHTSGVYLMRTSMYLKCSEQISPSIVEDWDLVLTAIDNGARGQHLDRVVFYYRLHPSSVLRRSRNRDHRGMIHELESLHPELFAQRRSLWHASSLDGATRLRYLGALWCRCYLPDDLVDRIALVTRTKSERVDGEREIERMRDILARVATEDERALR